MSSVYPLLTSTTLESTVSRAPLVFAVVQEDTTRFELAVHPLNRCDPVPKVLQLPCRVLLGARRHLNNEAYQASTCTGYFAPAC